MRNRVSKRCWIGNLVAVVTALTLLAGCGTVESQPAESDAPSALDAALGAMAPKGATLGVLRQGDVVAWLSSEPEQPVRGTADIDAYLVDAQGRLISDAKVTFDTDMTNMSHGQYLVPAESTGNGHYVGSVHFSMPGPWRVIALVERPGEQTTKLRFEFTVKPK
jgi:hypothetical protein